MRNSCLATKENTAYLPQKLVFFFKSKIEMQDNNPSIYLISKMRYQEAIGFVDRKNSGKAKKGLINRVFRTHFVLNIKTLLIK